MRWIVPPRVPDAETRLIGDLGLPPLVAAALVARGLAEPSEASAFLDPALDRLGDPSLLPDFRKAADALLLAREKDELVFIHGDYDVDGVTSAAILHRFLEAAGWRTIVHVPHRAKEGYGIHLDAVDQARRAEAGLFLTCDCGISAHAQVDAAVAAGMVVVVTDHHHVGEILPNAAAVVNPHRSDSAYPFSDLCGAGVVFRLCEGLAVELGLPIDKFRRAFLDLAAFGSIADMMPLVGENRILATHGLRHLGESRKVGIQALKFVSGIPEGRPVTAREVGFQLGPRVNAVGRMDDAAVALRLLLSRDEGEARELAKVLDQHNQERREVEKRILEEAIRQVESGRHHEGRVIVVSSPDWFSGVNGIVAGRLSRMYHRPTFVLTENSESGWSGGSGRSIPGFDLVGLIEAHPKLVRGGGHAAAAGCSFATADLAAVREAFETYGRRVLSDEDLEPALQADLDADPDELTTAAVEGLERLAPFGHGNPEILVHLESVPLLRAEATRKPEHVRLTVRAGGGTMSAMAFGMGGRLGELAGVRAVHLMARPSINEWQGRRSAQLIVEDWRPA